MSIPRQTNLMLSWCTAQLDSNLTRWLESKLAGKILAYFYYLYVAAITSSDTLIINSKQPNNAVLDALDDKLRTGDFFQWKSPHMLRNYYQVCLSYEILILIY